MATAWRQWWHGDRDKEVMNQSFLVDSGGSLRGFTLVVQPESNTVTDWALTASLAGP